MTVKSTTYQRYSLAYTLASPMRIGHRKIGNLQTTRTYVPGIAMWASTVNHLAGRFPEFSGSRDNPHLAWGEFLYNHCRFSCLFLCHPDDVAQPLYPARQGDCHILEQAFIDSSVHTAIRHDSFVRDEGMLHELEWIVPHTLPLGERTRLTGWVDVEATETLNPVETAFVRQAGGELVLAHGDRRLPLKDIFEKATVGADLNKGCGVLELEDCKEKGTVGPKEPGRSPVPGQILATGPMRLDAPLETVVGRCWLPLDSGEPEQHSPRPGGYLYHYLAYLPGVELKEVEKYTLGMDWQGRFRLSSASHADPEKG